MAVVDDSGIGNHIRIRVVIFGVVGIFGVVYFGKGVTLAIFVGVVFSEFLYRPGRCGGLRLLHVSGFGFAEGAVGTGPGCVEI